MSKSLRWTPEQLKQKGLVQNSSGDYVKVESLVTKGKVEKLPSLIERAIPTYSRENEVVSKLVGNIKTTVQLKPLSVNEVWQGKRFKTDKYKQYALAVSLLLPNNLIVPEGLLRVYYEFGLSTRNGDWDNPVKPFQDILQEKYQFNDSRIMEATVKKVIVSKGQEYITFRIESL